MLEYIKDYSRPFKVARSIDKYLVKEKNKDVPPCFFYVCTHDRQSPSLTLFLNLAAYISILKRHIKGKNLINMLDDKSYIVVKASINSS